MISAFEGNWAETKAMLPVIEAFKTTYALTDVTVVADAGMLRHDNREGIQAAGLSYILGAKLTQVPYVIEKWLKDNPGAAPADGLSVPREY